jgi:hypothetical protein
VRALCGRRPGRLAGTPEASGGTPVPAGRPGVGCARPAPVAHDPLAAGDQGRVAQKVRGGARVAHHGGGRSPHRLVVGRAGRPWAARGAQVLWEQPAGLGHGGRDGRLCPSPPRDRAVPRGSSGGIGVGPVSGPVVAGVPPTCGHGEAGFELSALAGVATAPSSSQSGSPTRPFFPRGRIAGVVRCQPCTERWRGGYATSRCSGGGPQIGSWISAHLESSKELPNKEAESLGSLGRFLPVARP